MTFAIKSSGTNIAEKISDIQRLDEQISKWWSALPQHLKLAPSDIPTAEQFWLPKTLQLNIVYHQCLCALHASIVPLFCWAASDEVWALARRTSAQMAYENACAISMLIDATLSHYPKLTAMPAFVSYAAYCGCAIQIPFMWSQDLQVKGRAHLHVRANIRMIRIMATSWKFADLLVSNLCFCGIGLLTIRSIFMSNAF